MELQVTMVMMMRMIMMVMTPEIAKFPRTIRFMIFKLKGPHHSSLFTNKGGI